MGVAEQRHEEDLFGQPDEVPNGPEPERGFAVLGVLPEVVVVDPFARSVALACLRGGRFIAARSSARLTR